MEVTEEGLAGFFSMVLPLLNERQQRLMAAAAVELFGRGGQARVAEAAGMSRNTLIAGAKELAGGAGPSPRVRRPGAGRKKAIDVDPELLVVLDSLVEPESRGDPMSPLRWTVEVDPEAGRASWAGSAIGPGRTWWARLLHYLGYSLQANAKVTEGAQHPDRDGQFRYINDTAAEHLAAGQPVISVDCKKKELVGDYANGGAEWEPEGRTDPGRHPRLPRPRGAQGHPLRGATTSAPTRAGSTSATTTTPPPSRSPRSPAGGNGWAGPATRTPPG